MDATVVPSALRFAHKFGLSPSKGDLRVGVKATTALILFAAAVYASLGAYAAHLYCASVPGPMTPERLVHCLIAFVYGPSALPMYSLHYASSKRAPRPVAPPVANVW